MIFIIQSILLFDAVNPTSIRSLAPVSQPVGIFHSCVLCLNSNLCSILISDCFLIGLMVAGKDSFSFLRYDFYCIYLSIMHSCSLDNCSTMHRYLSNIVFNILKFYGTLYVDTIRILSECLLKIQINWRILS